MTTIQAHLLQSLALLDYYFARGSTTPTPTPTPVCTLTIPVYPLLTHTFSSQTLVDVFHAPLVRWLEQQENDVRAGTGCPISRTDIAIVFSNLDELVVFSRYLFSTRSTYA